MWQYKLISNFFRYFILNFNFKDVFSYKFNINFYAYTNLNQNYLLKLNQKFFQINFFRYNNWLLLLILYLKTTSNTDIIICKYENKKLLTLFWHIIKF
jgi:hypothetical protein